MFSLYRFDESQTLNKERMIERSKGQKHEGPVVYWMNRDQRVLDNWALIRAQTRAMIKRVPLIVVFCIDPESDMTVREAGFMLRGLRQVERSAVLFECFLRILTTKQRSGTIEYSV